MVKNTFTTAAILAAVAMTPMTAGAASITSSGVSGDFMCDAPLGTPAAEIDVLAGGSFNASFEDADTAGAFCFDLVNSSNTDVAVTVLSATVNQLPGVSFFEGGVETFSSLDNLAFTVAEGEDFSAFFSFNIAAGTSVVFDWAFGDPVSLSPNLSPDFDFQVFAAPTAVPLPAGAALMGTAIAGFGVARRRKNKAA